MASTEIPGGSATATLAELLSAFATQQIMKFWERHDKQHAQGRKSVCDEDFDWSNDLDLKHIEEHLREEFSEWLFATPEQRALEDIDIANMAFLDWAFRRLRQRQD